MVHHPLTTSGITQFRSDWEKARQALAEKAKTPTAAG
jgi:transaldolase